MRMQIKQIIMSITAMIRALELDEELVSMLTFAAFKTLGEAVGTPRKWWKSLWSEKKSWVNMFGLLQ